jgi:carbon-monoxide dehydrogenase large subunit
LNDVSEFGIGQPVRRKEDERLLTGRGRFTDDFNLPGQAYAALVRSPHAHARVRGVDMSDARAAPGVLAVLTAEDYLADGLKALPDPVLPVGITDPTKKVLANKDGSDIFLTPMYPLSRDKVRHVGDPVAFVVAETPAQAADAAELVAVDYEVLPAVIDMTAAIADGAPAIWDEAPRNFCIDMEMGDRAATEAAFAEAAHVAELDLANNRVSAAQMEPRSALGEYDPAANKYTLYAGSQGAYRHKLDLSKILPVPIGNIRVLSHDVGGGFGVRTSLYGEFVLVLWAARKLGRPVKWTCERSEAMISDLQARGLVTKGKLALDADGRFLALRIDHLYDVGAYTYFFTALANGINLLTGSYAFPTAFMTGKAVFTNTVAVSPYRGAGRPEALFNLERLIDTAAAEMGLDRADIRRRNLVSPDQIPFTTPMGVYIDSGEFIAKMDDALALADWPGYAARRAASNKAGKLRGIGLCNYIETPVGWPRERTDIEVKPGGTVDVVIGTGASGQGHETSFAQVIVEWLGVPFDSINLITGDTDIVVEGGGSHSDRSMRLAGQVMVEASEEIIAKGKRIASHVLEAAAADIEFAAGVYSVSGTDRTMGIFDVAKAAAGVDLPQELRGPLAAEAVLAKRLPAYPNGCAICEVEIEPDTGKVRIVRYSAVDDVGTVINPMIVEGQIHGGIAQGAGQALMEDCLYDPATGQLLAGSFLDYAVPRADDFPSFALGHGELAAPSNRLGVKGGGEGGTTPSLAAVVNAVVDALREFGVRHVSMPATPEKVWRAMTGR